MNSASLVFKPTWKKILLFLGPGILLYSFIVIVPIAGAFRQSLYTNFNFQFRFAGVANYVQLLQDGDFWFAFRNNLIILGLSLVLQISLAFVIAVMMNSSLIKFARFSRAVMFFPVILSAVVVGFIWVLIYNVHWGLLNTMLAAVGLSSWQQLWLDDPNIVIYSITVPLMWQYLGLFLVVFLAGLSAIPGELLEAAEIDGANGFYKTLYVTLPLLAGTWRIVLILAISGAVKVFEQPYVMTRGGPGISSTVLAQYAYNMSFARFDLTYGSTVAVGMLVLSFALIALTWLFTRYVVFRGKEF